MQEHRASITQDIVEQYCLLPDPFRGGQVDRDEFRVYCQEDLASRTYLLDNLVAAIRARDELGEAGYAGVLAHRLGDSTCPAHAFMPADSPLTFLTDMLPPSAAKKKVDFHTEIERTTPEFDLGGRKPLAGGATAAEAADGLLDRTYAAIKVNRAHIIELMQAVYAGDEAAVNRVREIGARAGAELLADAYFTASQLAGAR